MKGVISLSNRIIVYDFRGVPFYAANKTPPFRFNVPEGGFLFAGKYEYSEPLKFKLPKLPEPEHFYKIKKPNLITGNNPYKASIFPDSGKIIADSKLSKLPFFVIVYIFFHEAGHNFYKTEWKCDVFANYWMLKRGYNPSQCRVANQMTLKSLERQKINLEYNKKVYAY